VIDRIGRLIALTPRDRRVVLLGWLLFRLVGPALRLCSVTTLLPRGEAAVIDDDPARVERIAWLVAAAGRRGRRRPSCLEEALVLAWLLRFAGVPATIRIGVARRAGALHAHAWLEHRGRILLGSGDGLTYEPLHTAGGAAGLR
jgi:hypothetical protein